jgi:septum formation protein
VTLPLLLASASPRRRELLERVGVELEVRTPDVDESAREGEAAAAYVTRIAHAKALAVPRRPGQWVLAADTTVTVDGAILGKAESPEEAAAMLSALSGKTHQVLTAYVVAGDRTADGLVSTDVEFVDIDAATLADYVASGEWRGKAGAYAIQGIGCALVREVRGSVTNVIGLPVVEVLATLRGLGGPVARLARGQPQ